MSSASNIQIPDDRREAFCLTGDDLDRLTDSITELSDQVEVLRDGLDNIRSDRQWAVQNDRLVALPIGARDRRCESGTGKGRA